jgi:hypothetical protein
MEAARSDKIIGKLDAVGACLSFACAVHCMLMPFIITLLPLIGLDILTHGSFDKIMFITTLSLASASLCWGTFIHRERRILFFVVAAMILFYLGGFSVHSKHEALLVGFGGLCLAVGHFLNRRLCKSCAHCCSHEASVHAK